MARFRVGGAWKKSEAVYIKVGGVWRKAEAVYIKANGVWQKDTDYSSTPITPSDPITHSINVSDTLRYSSDWGSSYYWAKVSAYTSGNRYNCFGMSVNTYNAALIQIPAFARSGTKLSCSFYGYCPESHTFRWALCTSMNNKAMYQGKGAVTGDSSQIASGTFTLNTAGTGSYTYSFAISASIPANTPLYLYLWPNESGGAATHILTGDTFDAVLS